MSASHFRLPRWLASPTLVGVALVLASSLSHASGEYVLSGMVSDGDRCRAVRSTSVDVSTQGAPQLDRTLRKAYRAGVDRELVLEGGITQLSVWGNVDLANRIQVLGINGASVRERDRHGGAPNGSRGCDTRGSVDLEVTLPALPTTTSRGRLRFEFPAGNPFEIPIVLKPFPESLALSWPAQIVGGEARGQHYDCLRSNGGAVTVDGNTLQIAINPDNPIPTGCNAFQLAYRVPTDNRDIAGGCSGDRQSVTAVTGLPSGRPFAQGQTLRTLRACGDRDTARAGLIPAFSIDYAAAIDALRKKQLNAAKRAATRTSDFDKSRVPSLKTPPAPQQGGRVPAEPIEFSVVLSRFNNLANLHSPMKVRIVEAKGAARSNIQVNLFASRLCGQDSSVVFTDRSTSDLAIVSRQLDLGDGTRRSSVEPIRLTHRYTRNGRFTAILTVTDSNNVSRQARRDVTIPQTQSGCQSPDGDGGRGDDEPDVINPGSGPNLLPQTPAPAVYLRRIGGLGNNIMINGDFCSVNRLANNQAAEVTVPDVVWGVSSAGARSDSTRVELRDAKSGTLLSSFDSGPLNANDAAVMRRNYPGRPTRVKVVNVTGGDTMRAYGNQVGCFLDHAAPLPRLDPPFLLVVDPLNAIAEGPDRTGAESDNKLRF